MGVVNFKDQDRSQPLRTPENHRKFQKDKEDETSQDMPLRRPRVYIPRDGEYIVEAAEEILVCVAML
jgi:hypothetical protein